MGVLGKQVLGVRCNRAIREDVVIRVSGDDSELEGGGHAQEVSAGEFPKTIIPYAIRRALRG